MAYFLPSRELQTLLLQLERQCGDAGRSPAKEPLVLLEGVRGGVGS